MSGLYQCDQRLVEVDREGHYLYYLRSSQFISHRQTKCEAIHSFLLHHLFVEAMEAGKEMQVVVAVACLYSDEAECPSCFEYFESIPRHISPLHSHILTSVYSLHQLQQSLHQHHLLSVAVERGKEVAAEASCQLDYDEVQWPDARKSVEIEKNLRYLLLLLLLLSTPPIY